MMVRRRREEPTSEVAHVLEFDESSWPGRCVGEKHQAWDAEWRRVFETAKRDGARGVVLPMLRAHLEIRRQARHRNECATCGMRR